MKENDIRSRATVDKYLELVEKDCETFFSEKDHYPNTACCACACPRYKPQFTKYGFHYVTCQNCHTLYVSNRPPLDQLLKFYSQSVSSTYWTRSFFQPVLEARRKKIFLPRVKSVVTEFGTDRNWVIGDVGAGFGIFLDELRKKWVESRFIALEPSFAQAEICRGLGLDVECCFAEELAGYDGAFDLLTSFELFEHLTDPSKFVRKMHRLLKPGGHFLMTTLNGKGFDIQLLWEKSKSVTPPHHLNFFNPNSICLLLESSGFENVSITTPGELDWDIVEGMIVNANFDAGRFWGEFAGSGSPQAKADLQNWISRNNFSSHMKVVAQKPTVTG